MNCTCPNPGSCPKYSFVDRQDWQNCRASLPLNATEDPFPCVYLGREHGAPGADFPATYECRVYGECVRNDATMGMSSCHSCLSRLSLNSSDFSKKFTDPLIITNSKREQTNGLHGFLKGGPAFLFGGGPSAKGLHSDTELHPNGVFTMGINNAAAMFRTASFICSDPPSKFHHNIYRDATMMKFVPITKLKAGTRIREKIGDEFCESSKFLQDYPNVWGYSKRGWLAEDATFFTETSASLGNYEEGVRLLNAVKAPLTLFAAIRVLYYLGAREIYLVGVDFKMDKENPYSFPQKKDAGGVENNNERYTIINKMFVGLRPHFEHFGLKIFNTNLESQLTAFEFVKYNEAIERTKQVNDDYESLGGWYEK